MDLRLDESVVMITGASGGIGEACAEQFARERAFVIVGYHTNKDNALRVVSKVKELGGDGFAVNLDLNDLNSIESCISEVHRRVGKINSLILNAAANRLTEFEDISPAEWDSILSINLRGPFFLLQKFIPYFQDGASVVFISSIAGQSGAPGHAHYAAAKSALINLSKSAAKRLAPAIRVNCVSPGICDTSMGREAIKGATPDYVSRLLLSRRVALPEEIANVIVFMASPVSSFIYGATIDANGGRELR